MAFKGPFQPKPFHDSMIQSPVHLVTLGTGAAAWDGQHGRYMGTRMPAPAACLQETAVVVFGRTAMGKEGVELPLAVCGPPGKELQPSKCLTVHLTGTAAFSSRV